MIRDTVGDYNVLRTLRVPVLTPMEAERVWSRCANANGVGGTLVVCYNAEIFRLALSVVQAAVELV